MGRDTSLAEPTPPGPDAGVAVKATARKAKKRRRAPLWAKVLVSLGVVLVVAASATFVGGQLLAKRYEGAVQREDLLGDAVKPEVPPRVEGPLTFLVIGSDSREGANHNPNTLDGNAAAVAGARSDTIILMHVPASMDRAYVISIPRDSWVPIAQTKGDGLDGSDKINAAFNEPGGSPRLVKTVQRLTGLTIDYPVVVDFSAVRKLTDLVGGVDVVVDETSYDESRFMPANTRFPTTKCYYKGIARNCLTFKKGQLHLDGELAEYYVRQRKGLKEGDLDRAKRQQQYLRALMAKAVDGGMLTNPKKFDELVITVAEALTVDTRMPVKNLAFTLKDLRPANLVFMTLPINGLGMVGDQSVVFVNKPRIAELATAIKTGAMDQYLVKYPTAANDVTHGQ